MAIADDFSIDRATGNIRYTGDPHGGGTPTYYTVIAFHRWLQDEADNATSSGDDELDITDADPSSRATDNIITLINGYNINQYTAEHLYDGSIVQAGGNDVWDGLVVVGAVETGTEPSIIQNNKVLPSYWGTGLNADAANNIIMRIMVKTRSGGSDIDGKRLRVQAREMGDSYAEFSVTMVNGNNTAALFTGPDLNYTSTDSAIQAFTIGNTEGYASIDADNDGTDENYYSAYDLTGETINDLYELIKWRQKRSLAEDDNTSDTGTDYTVGNGTLTGQAQSFTTTNEGKYLMRCAFRVKKTGTPTGNATAVLYASTAGVIPTGAALATSDNFDVEQLTTTYSPFEFVFSTPYLMTASTQYCIALEYTGGDGSNYIQCEGAASGTKAGENKSDETSSTWTARAAEDLWFEVFSSPQTYEMPGELFRGITHEWDVDGIASGPLQAVEPLTWAGGSGQMLATDSVSAPTKVWIQLLTGTVPADNTTITAGDSSATFLTEFTGGQSTSRTVSSNAAGTSTGSALIGAYGFGVLAADLGANDRPQDLTATVKTPPNNVTFSVTGLTATHDRVLVAAEDGAGDVDYDQLTLMTSLTTDDITSVVVTTAIPSDTPASGYIRVQDDNGRYRRLSYSSWDTSTFTIDESGSGEEDFMTVNATQPRNVFISYIDKAAATATESFQVPYNADRDMYVRVRRGTTGTLTKSFETTVTLTSTGASIGRTETPDS